MLTILQCIVLAVCVHLGNTKNQSPSEERFNFFDAELIQVFVEKEDVNLLISPVSVKFVLGMLMEGAAGKTAKEIRMALRVPEGGDNATQKEFNTWSSLLQVKESSNVLKIANRMFLSAHHTLNPEFRKTLERYYSGGVTEVEFENAKETSELINNWVGKRTSQLIPSIVEESQINANNKLIMTSAVYFKGLWETPFATERTTTRCFYPKGKKCKDVLMMTDTGYFNYGYISRLDAQAIVLPYKDESFSMVLLLPSKRDGIDQLARDLVHVSLKSVLSETDRREVYIQIPQFEMSYNEDLVDALKKVHISQVFGEKANLSNIFVDELESTFVSHIFHSAKITVTEEGTEAAAATGALFVPLMGGPSTSFIANHPFLFFIIEPTNILILFAGKVFSPQIPEKSRATSLPNKQTFHNLVASSNPKSDKPNDSLLNGLKESKNNQRSQLGVPKFRSIRPNHSTLSLPSSEKADSTGSSFQRRISRPASFYDERPQEQFNVNIDKFRKRGKAPPDLLKSRKAQSEDWSHHVLYFL